MSEGTLNTYTFPGAQGIRAESENMDNRTFKQFCETVKEAIDNDPIWYAGYLWIDLTERQVNKVVELIPYGNNKCKYITRTIANVIFQRDVITTPGGFKLYGDSKKVIEEIKNVVDGCESTQATRILFDLYNDDFITPGEYNSIYDWIEEHTDGNGAVLKEWWG